MAKTPITAEGLSQFDHLPALEAVLLAWTVSGRDPKWHLERQNEVRQQMPVLARALDRLGEEK